MNKFKKFGVFIISFLVVLFSWLSLSGSIIKAETNYSNYFQDGISNWKRIGSAATLPTSQTGSILVKKGATSASDITLDYTFGGAQNNSGKVVKGMDSNFLKPTEGLTSASQNMVYSKMNIFMNNAGNYYGAVFQGKSSDQTEMLRQASSSSPDFLITPANYTGKISSREFALLGYSANNNGNIGLTNKQYYVGTDDNGNPAYKIVGEFTREAESSSGNQAYHMYAEILLRPSPSNAAFVQRELYLYNPGQTPQTFQTWFGEDTALGSAAGSNDLIVPHAIGGGIGLYIGNNPGKLMVTNVTNDGFTDFTGHTFNNTDWSSGFTNGVGQASAAADAALTTTLTDTAYTLKWPSTSLAAGKQAHFSSTMGLTYVPYALVIPKKEYTNQTAADRKDTTNRIGDKLNFSLKLTNYGQDGSLPTSWLYTKMEDTIPNGLDLDTKSIKVDGVDATSASTYDPTTRLLTVDMKKVSVGANKTSTITYNATIDNSANTLSSITNTAYFYGRDANAGTTTDTKYNAQVTIPITKTNFYPTLTKLVKNESDGTNAQYASSADAKYGDILDYQVKYNLGAGSDSMKDGATLSDDLPSGLQLVPGSVNYSADNGSDSLTNGDSLRSFNLGAMSANQTATLTFKAKVNASVAGVITNTATATGIKTNSLSIGDLTSQANVSVSNVNAFLSVPDIDFGQTNMYGSEKVLKNVATNGGLQIMHPSTNDFSVNVSYDNNNDETKMKSGSDTLTDDGSGLLFIRQRTSSPDDPGSFTPISASGTPIQTALFKGGSDQPTGLSGYVGVGDWKIKLAANTKVGSYKGTLTWTMVDSPN